MIKSITSANVLHEFLAAEYRKSVWDFFWKPPQVMRLVLFSQCAVIFLRVCSLHLGLEESKIF